LQWREENEKQKQKQESNETWREKTTISCSFFFFFLFIFHQTPPTHQTLLEQKIIPLFKKRIMASMIQ